MGDANVLPRRAWVWTGSGSIQDLSGLIPKKSGWTLDEAMGLDAAGNIVGQGQLASGAVHGFLLTPTAAPAAAAIASDASLTQSNAPILAPVETTAGLPLSRTVSPALTAASQSSVTLIPLMSVTDRYTTMIGTEVIHLNTKRKRGSLLG